MESISPIKSQHQGNHIAKRSAVSLTFCNLDSIVQFFLVHPGAPHR